MEQPPMNQNYGPGAPPPTYQQQGSKPGQTYYQPPPPQQNFGGQQQHPPSQPANFQRRIVNFYNPPQRHKVGMMRRFVSICGCCIIIGLVVGLAAGLATRSNRYATYNNSAYCRTNSDCYNRYGSGTYCYNGYCSR